MAKCWLLPSQRRNIVADQLTYLHGSQCLSLLSSHEAPSNERKEVFSCSQECSFRRRLADYDPLS